jgi:hypothetical protein
MLKRTSLKLVSVWNPNPGWSHPKHDFKTKLDYP